MGLKLNHHPPQMAAGIQRWYPNTTLVSHPVAPRTTNPSGPPPLPLLGVREFHGGKGQNPFLLLFSFTSHHSLPTLLPYLAINFSKSMVQFLYVLSPSFHYFPFPTFLQEKAKGAKYIEVMLLFEKSWYWNGVTSHSVIHWKKWKVMLPRKGVGTLPYMM